jgi:hypothetical protein
LGNGANASLRKSSRRWPLTVAPTREAQDRDEREPDHKLVIKVFNPYARATWLLTESDPDNPDRLFGLCDPGIGSPEIGYVLRSEIEEVGVKIGCYRMPLERDEHFKAKHWGNMRTTQTRLEGSWRPQPQPNQPRTMLFAQQIYHTL